MVLKIAGKNLDIGQALRSRIDETVTGTVERIGLRSTRIRTGDKTLVTVPNKQMVDSVVDNWSLRTERREEIRLELSSSIPAATLQLITAAVKKIIDQYNEQIINADVFVKDISRNAIIITIEFFTKDIAIKEFFQLKENINLQVKKLLEEFDGKIRFQFRHFPGILFPIYH